ncbi:efflux RND transporter periplasmic adaptor subunit [Gallaecimonas mangrovi]|uniref:efflux RND transporter periplasmic adaptor subunit n=1 Tax=Gallaecimonas mangrovi TaxID=2291597 RepID=UPI000E20B3B8|nr:efflux RND transporter periplasmic adaptor subunit [Gallaecimonas mangrovi]
MSDNSSSQTQNQQPAKGTRRKRLLILAAVVVIVGAGYGAWWWTSGQYYQSTDDAYVAGDHIAVGPEVNGTVVAVKVDDTQTVKAGQVLVQLDQADAKLALAKAEANLASTVRSVHALFKQSDGLAAQIKARQVELKQAQADLSRREKVAAQGGVSREDLQHAKDKVAQLQATLTATEKDLDTVKVRIDNTTVANHPDVQAAAEQVREAALALARTTVKAPADGVVVNRVVQVGQRVNPGQVLMTVVPINDVWVDANFKEVQLTDVRVGQPVTLTADLYGSSVTYHGKVAGLSAGTGNAFALLPIQNASGNWIKIVQRLPVRIALQPSELKEHPLRVGLSMDAEIDLHDQSGSLVASKVMIGPKAKPEDAVSAAVNQQITDIIRRNIGAVMGAK